MLNLALARRHARVVATGTPAHQHRIALASISAIEQWTILRQVHIALPDQLGEWVVGERIDDVGGTHPAGRRGFNGLVPIDLQRPALVEVFVNRNRGDCAVSRGDDRLFHMRAEQIADGVAGPVHFCLGNNDGDVLLLSRVANGLDNVTLHGPFAYQQSRSTSFTVLVATHS